MQEPTEGEKIIEYFLEDENIKYVTEKEIKGLKDDSLSFRKADFYLPKYKVYVEFLGEWSKPEGKARYIKKMEVYKENRIPCIYIYPDNMGTLKYLFYMRLRKELETHPELKPQLIRYKLTACKKILGIIWGIFLIFALVGYLSQITPHISITFIYSIILLFLITIGSSIYVLKTVFSKNKKNNQ